MGPSQKARKDDLACCKHANSLISKVQKSASAGFLRGSQRCLREKHLTSMLRSVCCTLRAVTETLRNGATARSRGCEGGSTADYSSRHLRDILQPDPAPGAGSGGPEATRVIPSGEIEPERPPAGGDEPVRRIVHVDMDAFYASVEQRDEPSLRGRPVIVGGDPHGRGVVAACSYEARRFGIHSAMPAAQARRRCPDAVFLRPDFRRYVAVSRQIRAIFRDYTPLVEPLSLDEAFLDVTEERGGLRSATAVARTIRARIREELELTASAGVAPIKFVAKIASDHRKPDGLTVVRPGRVQAFLDPLPVARIWGVGPATERRLLALGLETIAQVRACARATLVDALGESLGGHIHLLSHGIDERRVVPHRSAKSHGAERTLAVDLDEPGEMRSMLAALAEEVVGAVKKDGRRAWTVTIKVRYADFTTLTRSQSLSAPTDDRETVARTAQMLLDRTEAGVRPVRLLGVTLGNLAEEDTPVQLPLPF